MSVSGSPSRVPVDVFPQSDGLPSVSSIDTGPLTQFSDELYDFVVASIATTPATALVTEYRRSGRQLRRHGSRATIQDQKCEGGHGQGQLRGRRGSAPQMLGDKWVDRSLANRNDFNADFIDQITRHVWCDIWTRPGT